MATVVSRCYTAATRSIAPTSVVGLHGDHLGVKLSAMGFAGVIRARQTVS
jgi:hypothetical protein